MANRGTFVSPLERDANLAGVTLSDGDTCTVAGEQHTYDPENNGSGWVSPWPRDVEFPEDVVGDTLVSREPIVAPNLQRIARAVQVRVGSLGDSITNNGGNTNYKGGAVLAACLQSAWRMRLVADGGVAGETSGQILSRAAAYMAANPQEITVLQCGTNDALNGVAPAQFAANLAAIIDIIRAYGSIPIVLTIPPYNSFKTTAQAILRQIQLVCMAKGAYLSRRWQAVNDGTFGFIAGASADNIHPYSNILWTEGAALLSELESMNLLPVSTPLRTESNAGDADNAFTNALFLTSTGGVAQGISSVGSPTLSISASPSGFGNRQVCTLSANAGTTGFGVGFGNLTTTKKYLIRMRVRATCSSGTMLVGTFRNGAVGIEPMQLTDPGYRVPAGTTAVFDCSWYFDGKSNTSINVYDKASNASGTLEAELPQLHCLTDLGLDH